VRIGQHQSHSIFTRQLQLQTQAVLLPSKHKMSQHTNTRREKDEPTEALKLYCSSSLSFIASRDIPWLGYKISDDMDHISSDR
jgi:hypothetical protein